MVGFVGIGTRVFLRASASGIPAFTCAATRACHSWWAATLGARAWLNAHRAAPV